MAEQPCEECKRKPHGLAGHEGLYLSSTRTPGLGHLFRCARCRSLWTRSYEGEGLFVWIPRANVDIEDAD